MNSTELKPWQARKLYEVVGRFQWYAKRLRERMMAKGFPHEDPLYQAVRETEKVLTNLQREIIKIMHARPPPPKVDDQRPPRSDIRRGGKNDRH